MVPGSHQGLWHMSPAAREMTNTDTDVTIKKKKKTPASGSHSSPCKILPTWSRNMSAVRRHCSRAEPRLRLLFRAEVAFKAEGARKRMLFSRSWKSTMRVSTSCQGAQGGAQVIKTAILHLDSMVHGSRHCLLLAGIYRRSSRQPGQTLRSDSSMDGSKSDLLLSS